MKPSISQPVVKSMPSNVEGYHDVMTVASEPHMPSLVLHYRLPLDQLLNRYTKRLFDLFVTTILGVAVMTWLLPLIALVIKLDSKGPVFFFQKRTARNGRLFTCVKFRTMVVNEAADELPASVNDQRITRAGRFLRRNHLDELPQLFNVLLGDMSLVGPRPHMVSDNDRYGSQLNFYAYRNKVKPGLTGLAQVHGHVGVVPNLDAMKERVKKDIHYIHHWTMLMDLGIIGKTCSGALFPRKSQKQEAVVQ